MIKRIVFLCSIIMLACAVKAQIFEPVKWSFSLERTGENEYNFIAEAAIEKDWHVYATQLPSEDGPVKTSFYFETGKELVSGKLQESPYETHHDEMFGMEVSYHEGTATFKQAFKPTKFPAQFGGELEFMVCNSERCLPPEFVPFSVTATGKETIVKSGAKASTEKKSEAVEVKEETQVVAPSTTETPQVFDPVTWSFRKTLKKDNVYTIRIEASIEEEWHVYALDLGDADGPIPTTLYWDTAKVTLVGDVRAAEFIEAYDDNFQETLRYYEHTLWFEQDVKLLDTSATAFGELEFMVCNAERCLPPTLVPMSTITEEKSALNSAGLEGLKINNLDITNPIADCGGDEALSSEKKSYWLIFGLGFIGGLIALLTPCVFPMIPLTVSFFTKKSEGSKYQSFLYGFFIFGIYLLLSIPFHVMDSIEPDILNSISTNITLNVVFFVVFVAFAISFFGYYELTLPSSFTNKVDSASNVGGLIGTFLMALTLALVSFSCTGPILGSLLAGSLSGDGGAIQLTIGMGAFGLALALPFGLFAAFPSWLNKLPKSGGWMNVVKGVLGFVELALAIKFLSNADLVAHWGILPREVFFGLWIVIGLALALYLLGILRLKHDYGKPKVTLTRKILAVVTLAFVVYLVPGLGKGESANRQLLSGFPPPMFYSVYEQESHCPLGINCFKDYEEGMAFAKENNMPVMLDFTGWACVNCRKMEENVWVDPAVFKILNEDVVLISLYVDDREALPEDEQVTYTNNKGVERKLRTIGNKWSVFQTENFVNNSQPFYALITPEGELLANPVGYTQNATEYAAYLKCAVNAFKNK